MQSLQLENIDSRYGVVTVSIGAVFVSGRHDISKIYKEADVQLYSAKHAGRNRVMIGAL